MDSIHKVLWTKIRQAIRSIYASVSTAEARSLVHSIEAKEMKISDLRSRLKKSYDQNRRLHQRHTDLVDAYRLDASDFVVSDNLLNYLEVDDLKEKVRQLESELISAKKGPIGRVDRIVKFNENLKTKLKQQVDFNRTFGVLVRYLAQETNLNNNVFKIIGHRKYDYVIAHDILGLSAASAYAEHLGVPLIVDIVEEYDLTARSGDFFRRNLSVSEATLINKLIFNLILTCDKFIHIGPRQIEKFKESTGKRGVLLPNFRNEFISDDETTSEASRLLEDNDLRGTEFVCIPNRIMHSYEITLLAGALAKSKLKLPIVHVGAPLGPDASMKVREYCESKRIRFIELGLLDYDVYRAILQRAKFCSFITKEDVYNVKYAFPNRLFDAISTKTPILTHGFVQVGEFVDSKRIGVYTTDKLTIVNLSESVTKLVDNIGEFQKALDKQAKLCSWDTVFNRTFKTIKQGSSVAIITRKDVRKNQRVNNLRRSFLNKGCKVTVIGGCRGDYDVSDHEFYTVPLNRGLNEEELYS